MIMKYVKSSFIALMALLTIVACGGGGDGDESGGGGSTAGKNYRQSVTLPATGAEQIVELDGITAEINSITGAEDWLTILKNGEKPSNVKLVAKDNESLENRRCFVTIVDKANNSLVLTVTQNRRDAITYKQSVTLPPTDAVAEVELKDLKYEIKYISGNASWLTVQKAFKDGTAWVTLKATDNEKKEDRSCTVVITGQSNDEVRLSVIQTKKAGPDNDGINDSHDMQTDQPAYSR